MISIINDISSIQPCKSTILALGAQFSAPWDMPQAGGKDQNL